MGPDRALIIVKPLHITPWVFDITPHGIKVCALFFAEYPFGGLRLSLEAFFSSLHARCSHQNELCSSVGPAWATAAGVCNKIQLLPQSRAPDQFWAESLA